MKLFQQNQLLEAHKHVEDGGQALHLMTPKFCQSWNEPGIPRCFDITRSHGWAHLMDADVKRLLATARHLGIKRIVISNFGKRGQHVDLCGAPLDKAVIECGHEGGMYYATE